MSNPVDGREHHRSNTNTFGVLQSLLIPIFSNLNAESWTVCYQLETKAKVLQEYFGDDQFSDHAAVELWREWMQNVLET